ncbi:MAG TPA: IS1182 family transposase [Myxococcota bacterium]|nr:IS1182 family transposase [Myxococcota bacterium]
MAKTFREWDVNQGWLLPPSVHELVPPNHLSHFVRDTVRTDLDLSAILNTYQEERGYPPYHPVMMTALLLYAYTQGVFSSRRIARACEERVDFMAVTALQKPDFRTVNDFRRRHLKALGELFVQVLKLCRRAGLAKLGHVALDGTKIKANASKHKAMSYARMQSAEKELADTVAGWLKRAEAEDEAEDREFGEDRRGDELPDWVKNKQERLARIRAAKQALEEEAKREKEGEGGGTPPAKSQRNFTDPDSRIMKTRNGFEQAYNCQAAVDHAHQIIVAATTTRTQNDNAELPKLLDAIVANTGEQADEVSADSGYCSEDNLKNLNRRRVRGYIATGRQRHGDSSAIDKDGKKLGPRAARMNARLRQGGWRSRYRFRKQTVEPVFGQIKEAMGFRRFLLRGYEKVSAEWLMVCAAFDLRKLAKAMA